MISTTYEVIVIGGGHAGVEAAWAAANLLSSPTPGTPAPRVGSNARTIALITLDPTKIGVMSCNPAIGGLAKGQLVREIDAMGGLMGLATDATGIQFKVLNQSKGPAVQGPRAQCDKHAYAAAVQVMIASRPEIEVIGASVDRIIVENHKATGVIIKAPTETRLLHARAIVLTTGTFMRGLMHTGEERTPGGRHGESAAHGISDSLRELGFELGRLKTGTPPRLKRESIMWKELDEQAGDDAPQAFSDLNRERACGLEPTARAVGTSDDDCNASVECEDDAVRPDGSRFRLHDRASSLSAWWRTGNTNSHTAASLDAWRASNFLCPTFPLLPQVSCRMSSTNASAHDTIRANLHRAPMYTGQIESAGPRYCPSIEDKVVRFAQRDSHGVFLEPESHASNWVYCNGISTSLPPDVQDKLVRTMPGCEAAEILRYGYAVEYDMVRPHQISTTGETKLVENLFLAGQINGTSGYEEAAAQGLVAGINAARRALGQSDFSLGRDQAYIGVLMDDLVTKTPVEPYRMFTSRAEHRLLLRSDNAWHRLTPLAQSLGLLSNTLLGNLRIDRNAQFEREAAELNTLIDATTYEGQPVEKLLRGQSFDVADLKRSLAGPLAHCAIRFDERVWRFVHAQRRYATYIIRQHAEVRRQAEMEHKPLPPETDYLAITHLRPEARQSLHRFRPRTFGQAARLEGITPADITLLSIVLRRG